MTNKMMNNFPNLLLSGAALFLKSDLSLDASKVSSPAQWGQT
jgi:hypothetical protein